MEKLYVIVDDSTAGPGGPTLVEIATESGRSVRVPSRPYDGQKGWRRIGPVVDAEEMARALFNIESVADASEVKKLLFDLRTSIESGGR